MHRQSFELLILGTSSATPTSERNPSGQLLNVCERYFLIDCGEGTQMQLRRFRSKFQAIGHILVSHMHGDHFFGLPGLLSSMHLLGRQQPLRIYCPKELKEVMDVICTASDTRFNFQIEWVFTSRDGMRLLFEDEKVEVYSFPLKHRIHCTGFLFREKPLPRKIDKTRLTSMNISFADIHRLKAGLDVVSNDGKTILNRDATVDPPPPRSYAYCSDTVYDPKVADYVAGAGLLYHESTFLEDNSERAGKTFHSTAKQAATIAKLAGVGQLMLGHYSSRYPDVTGFLSEAEEIFPRCLLATEGKIVKI
jgi:ribonuclease Z